MKHVCDGRELTCAGCTAMARRHVLVREAMTAGDRLDDITRVRIWHGVAERLAAPRRPRARWPIAVAVAAVAATAVVVVIRGEQPHTLTVAAGATLTSPIGPHTRAALVGPADLEVVGSPGDATVVRLRTGTLLAEFEGGAGRSLAIEAPGVLVEVVGTLFAVEAREHGSCVSVAHGKVRVTTAAVAIEVTGGESFCSHEGVRPIAPAIEQALDRHEAVITARAPEPPAAVPDRATVPEPPAVVPDQATAPEPSAVVTDRATAPEPSAVVPDRRATAPVRSTAATDRPATVAPPVVVPDRIPSTLAPVPDRALRPSPAATPAIAPDPIRSPAAAPVPDHALRPSPAATPGIAPDRIPSPAATAPDRSATAPASSPPVTATPGPATPVRIADTPPSPPSSAEDLYRTAEAALAARDNAGAERALARLVTEYASSPLVEQALYERARLAYQQRAWAAARRHLDRLLALPATRLAEPGQYLACRIAVEARDGEAAACLVAYRQAHPRSPHDHDVLGMLVQLDHAAGGCRGAASRLAELARTHPRSKLAVAWRSRCPEAP